MIFKEHVYAKQQKITLRCDFKDKTFIIKKNRVLMIQRKLCVFFSQNINQKNNYRDLNKKNVFMHSIISTYA